MTSINDFMQFTKRIEALLGFVRLSLFGEKRPLDYDHEAQLLEFRDLWLDDLRVEADGCHMDSLPGGDSRSERCGA